MTESKMPARIWAAPRTIAGTDIVPLASRPEYCGQRYEDPIDLDVADIVAMFDDGQADDADETWDYMTDLLEAREIDPDSFRCQMRSVGYSEEEIESAIEAALSSWEAGQ